MKTFTFKKGTYFVGDICYALKDKFYDGVWGEQGDYEDGVYETPDGTFAVGGTAYGDGSYYGTDGIDYLVDAGVIGVVPKKLWKTKTPTGGRIVKVKNTLVFGWFNGLFSVNVDGERYIINTK